LKNRAVSLYKTGIYKTLIHREIIAFSLIFLLSGC
jgi:hypothetical protein